MTRTERYLANQDPALAEAMRKELEESRPVRHACFKRALEHAERVGDTPMLGFLRAGVRATGGTP